MFKLIIDMWRWPVCTFLKLVCYNIYNQKRKKIRTLVSIIQSILFFCFSWNSNIIVFGSPHHRFILNFIVYRTKWLNHNYSKWNLSLTNSWFSFCFLSVHFDFSFLFTLFHLIYSLNFLRRNLIHCKIFGWSVLVI